MPHRDLTELLERGAAESDSPLDADQLWQRGQARRRRKRAGLAVTAVLGVLIAVAAAVAMWPQRSSTPFIEDGPVQPPPSATPFPRGGADSRWGPLAVIPGLTGDEALIRGTIEVTEQCVLLDTQGRDVLLLWPEARTSWDDRTRTITFSTFYRGNAHSIQLTDGQTTALEGGATSIEDDSTSTDPLIDRIDWVSRPHPSCLEGVATAWFVSDVMVLEEQSPDSSADR